MSVGIPPYVVGRSVGLRSTCPSGLYLAHLAASQDVEQATRRSVAICLRYLSEAHDHISAEPISHFAIKCSRSWGSELLHKIIRYQVDLSAFCCVDGGLDSHATLTNVIDNG